MHRFEIRPNEYLKHKIQAYYHAKYTGFKSEGNPDVINNLKNQFDDAPLELLRNAEKELDGILMEDLPKIKADCAVENFTICVIPRAKSENSYSNNQKLFRRGGFH